MPTIGWWHFRCLAKTPRHCRPLRKGVRLALNPVMPTLRDGLDMGRGGSSPAAGRSAPTLGAGALDLLRGSRTILAKALAQIEAGWAAVRCSLRWTFSTGPMASPFSQTPGGHVVGLVK